MSTLKHKTVVSGESARDPISVFGATGFIGSRFCELSGRKCMPVARESRRPLSDTVVYFISTTHNYHVFEDVHLDINTNLNVLVDVLSNLTPGVTFNFISSWFVYGETELPANEGSPCNPRGFYSITKLAAEQIVESYCRTFGVNYRILRLCNVYGPSDKGAGQKKNALQFLIDKMRDSQPIDLYHNGEFYRDYLHVDDASRAIAFCVANAPLNTKINIGSGQPIVFRHLMDIAKDKLASGSVFSNVEPPEFHRIVQVRDFRMDVTKLRTLGYTHEIEITKGIEDLCQQ